MRLKLMCSDVGKRVYARDNEVHTAKFHTIYPSDAPQHPAGTLELDVGFDSNPFELGKSYWVNVSVEPC
jgi:hypothetical protein